MSAADEIAHYYGRGEEQGRLSRPFRLEFVRTKELLSRYLPEPPALVLDIGGGPGAYAIWLAERRADHDRLQPAHARAR